jgi:hypothetical protein
MEEINDEKSLFEIIGFKYNGCLITLDLNPIEMVEKDRADNYEFLDDVTRKLDILRKFNIQGYLNHINDAALFAVYFGVPKDPDECRKWEELNHGHKVARIMNLISESGITTFKKLF